MLEEEMKLCTQHHLLTLFQCSHLKLCDFYPHLHCKNEYALSNQ